MVEDPTTWKSNAQEGQKDSWSLRETKKHQNLRTQVRTTFNQKMVAPNTPLLHNGYFKLSVLRNHEHRSSENKAELPIFSWRKSTGQRVSSSTPRNKRITHNVRCWSLWLNTCVDQMKDESSFPIWRQSRLSWLPFFGTEYPGMSGQRVPWSSIAHHDRKEREGGFGDRMYPSKMNHSDLQPPDRPQLLGFLNGWYYWWSQSPHAPITSQSPPTGSEKWLRE